MSEQMNAEEKLDTYEKMENMLTKINLQVENYPELKANENYLQLQRTINYIEEKLSAIRRTYNANVTKLNNMIETIPTRFYASALGFEKEVFYETEERKREDVDMKSLLKG